MLSPFPSRDIAPPPPKNVSSSLQDSLPGAHLHAIFLVPSGGLRAGLANGAEDNPWSSDGGAGATSVVSSLWPEMGSEVQDRLQSSSPINVHSLSRTSEL